VSTTVLNVDWFNQPAFPTACYEESNSQLNENEFDDDEMRIDVASARERTIKRFENLRAVKVNDQDLFPADHFQTADNFGGQFLSHEVYASLLDQYISKLRTADQKLLHNSVLGKIQNQFYCDSSPEYFFYGASLWDSRKLRDEREKFQIERPRKKVSDYVNLQKIKFTRQFLTGNRNPIKKKDDYLSQAVSPTQEAASLISAETVRLFEKYSDLLSVIPDIKLANDFQDLRNMLSIVFNCAENPVTPLAYQQFMDDWYSAPQPIQGALESQALLWKWLYMKFPEDRAKYFHDATDSATVINKKTKARSRRLEDLNNFLKDTIARANL
jgi:hypothetical protein